MINVYESYVKRLFDIILALIGIPFFIVIFIIIAPFIYFEDRGPIFYYADRLGLNGVIFKMYKFRSMRVNAPDLRNSDGSTYNSSEDFRVTKIGRFIRKTSLDEVPQILNVLKGDMSFVGPRPNLAGKILDEMSEEKKRLKVRPGITGYTQAYYRNSIPQKQKFEYDVYYVEHMSFLFDMKIFIKTIFSVLKKENIYVKRQVALVNSVNSKADVKNKLET